MGAETVDNLALYVLLIIMTLIGAVAGYFFKKATDEVAGLGNILLRPWLYIGAVLYFGAAILNIYILQELPYSKVLPLTSITYIWTLVISYFFLNETITKLKICGVFSIIIGTFFIALSR